MDTNLNMDFNNTQSYWLDSTEQVSYPALEEDIKVDVVVIGGGMVGITTAYFLKQKGLRVAIVEVDRILQGTTAHTTAKITSQHSLIYDKLQRQMGKEKAHQYAEANEFAIYTIGQIIKENNIQCDFSWQSSYVYTQSEQYIQKIMDEVTAASGLGIKASFVNSIPLPLSIKGAVRFEAQAQFHPRKYLLSLSKDIPGKGSHIFEKTKAVDIQEGIPATVITDKGRKIEADHVVIASHYPFYDAKGLYFTRLYAERSYIIGVKIKESFPGGMYINAENPTRSLRYQDYRGEQMILVAGDHHKTGHGQATSTHYQNLKDFASKTFTLEDVLYHWSAQDCMTLDGVPYIGHLTSGTPNIYIATGFGKWGMTSSTVAALIIKDLILEKPNPWLEVYSPSRSISLTSAANFIVQNADVALNFISGKLIPGPRSVFIDKGEAKSFDLMGQKVGAYKDEEGIVHMVDTTCTHLGCELKWNDAEKSWDCPCHGSRFTYKGEVVEGPAYKALEYFRVDSPSKE